MVITCKNREYLLSEQKDKWKLSREIGGVEVEYEIPKGAYIKDVCMDSPAMAAGLQNGDVITEIDGDEILTAENYEKKLLSLKPEDTVEVKIERQGPEGYTEITCTVEVSVLP